MSGEYAHYVLLACENGHFLGYKPAEAVKEQLSGDEGPFDKYPQYCRDCGSEAIFICKNCDRMVSDKAPIGFVNPSNDPESPDNLSLPNFCPKCGEAHPWTE